MRNPRVILDYLLDIRDQINMIARFLVDVDSADDLKQDPKTAYAVTRAFEIIGEATKNLPQSFRHQTAGEPPWSPPNSLRTVPPWSPPVRTTPFLLFFELQHDQDTKGERRGQLNPFFL